MMRLVLQVGGAEIDVEVSAAPGATVGQLAEALAGGPVAAGTGLVVEGRFLAAADAVAACGLRQGALVRFAAGPSGAIPAAVTPVSELRVVGGLVAGGRFPLAPGVVVVGRAGEAGNDIGVDAPTVSVHHALLHVSAGGTCSVEDLGSSNGTWVDGRFVRAVEPVPAESLLQMGAVQFRLAPVPAATDRAALGPPGARSGTAPFNRPPRRLVPAGPSPLAVPVAPADPAPRARFSWAMFLAPLLIGAVTAVVFEPIMAAFALFSPVMAVGTWEEDRRRVARERRRNAQLVATALAAFRSDLEAARATEGRRRAVLLPDPAETLYRAEAPSIRLWERRAGAADAFLLRLGAADTAWSPPLSEVHGTRLPEVDATLAGATLARSPVGVDLGPGRVLGVVGPRPAAVALLRSLVCQAAVHHGPADLRVAILADEQAVAGWDWAKWLPHAAGSCSAGREAADSLADSLAAARAQGEHPHLLLVVDGNGFTEGRVAPVRDLLSSGGAGAIVVAGTADRLPSACTTVVELAGPDGVARVTEPATGSCVDVLLAGVGEAGARRCARALAALDDPEAGDGSASLPDSIPLVGLLGLDQLHPSRLTARWRAARPGSLAAVVGVGRDGPLVLDLVADGPHALVAGTTGAGKSELLRTLVTSLAATYGPDRLTFVMVDYKGGSAFAECAALPHVVGMVTDLDEHLGARALRSLEAELRHRETELARAGAADIDEYASVPSPEPMPRLVVVIDEFATMASELPGFVDALVGVAQRGRSLGVHLVLATQRPSGAVSDSIRANTNLRVALRVQDMPDSTDVIGTTQAAALDRRRPGRGFVRLGHAELVGFQAALVTTVSPPDAGGAVRARPFTFAPPPGDGGGAGAVDGGTTDLVRLVEAARDAFAAAAAGDPASVACPPRRPWLDPLPASLLLDALPAGAVGLADEPDAQRQVPYRWEPASGNLLLYGVAGSGTTTALASIALALRGAGRPVHLYVLDFGNGALAPLAGLAEVGAVITAGERERQERLVRTLRAELERRRSALASGRPASWPELVLLVDNLGGVCAAFDDVAGLHVRDDLLRLLADGPPLGMVTVASADRPGAVPVAMSAVVQERLVFRLADPYDDTVFGLPPADGARRVPGRAVEASSRREVQVALPAPGGPAGLARAVAQVVPAPSPGAACPPPPIPVLPAAVALHQVAGAADLAGPEWFLPVGLGDADLAPAGFRLGAGDHALVAGPARSGKSTVLCALAALVTGARADAGVWAIVPHRSPLRDAASVITAVTDPAMVAATLESVLAATGPQLVLVDDADTLDDAAGAFAALFDARRPDVHVVAAGRADVLRSAYGHWVAHVRRSRQGIALRPHMDLDGDLWHTVLPRRGPARFGPGRGYLVFEGAVELVQAATVTASVPPRELPFQDPAAPAEPPASYDPQGAGR